ncbi:hypothetical protein MBLNU459_g5520t1 [Dothideomycetes sp. NU459]
MPLSPQAWAAETRQDEFTPKTEEARLTIGTVAAVFENSITPTSAAQKLATIWKGPLLRSKKETGTFPTYILWTIIAKSIPALGGDRPGLHRLVSMILSLSDQPDVLDEDGVAVRQSTVPDLVFWKDLPTFQHYLRDYAFNEIVAEDPNIHGTLQEQSARWTNAHMFAAIYLNQLETGDHIGSPIERSSMRHLARYSFMRGVETSTEKDDTAQIKRMEAHVPASANWILIAGQQILDACQQKLDSGEKSPFPLWLGGDDGGDWLWSGSWGFDLDRWKFWRQRFLHLAEMVENASMKETCLQAATEMQRLENGSAS